MARPAGRDLIEKMLMLTEPEVYKALDTGPMELSPEEVKRG